MNILVRAATRGLTVLFSLMVLSGLQAQQGKVPTPDADPRMDGIRELFDELTGIASGMMDPGDESGSLTDHFDAERFVAELRQHLRFPDEETRESFDRELEALQGSLAEAWVSWMVWDEYRIHDVEFGGDDTAVLVVKHWNDNLETYTHTRWWLSETDGRWMFYDFRDLDQNLQGTLIMAHTLNGGYNAEPWLPPFVRLMAAMSQAGSLEDLALDLQQFRDPAEALLEHELPDDLRGFALVMLVSGLLQSEEQNEETAFDVLDLLDELQDLKPQCMVVHYLRGDALVILEEYDRAVESYQRYADHFGWDADVCEATADVWFWNNEPEKAVEYAERGLADKASAWGCLATLAAALPDDEKSRIRPHFAKLEFDEMALDYIGSWAIQLGDLDAAREIYDLLREHHPHSDLIPDYQALLDQ